MHRRHLVILALAGAALAACTEPKTTAVTETSTDSNQGASCPTSHADAGVPTGCSPEHASPTPLGGL